jgi:hypothetical protein
MEQRFMGAVFLVGEWFFCWWLKEIWLAGVREAPGTMKI